MSGAEPNDCEVNIKSSTVPEATTDHAVDLSINFNGPVTTSKQKKAPNFRLPDRSLSLSPVCDQNISAHTTQDCNCIESSPKESQIANICKWFTNEAEAFERVDLLCRLSEISECIELAFQQNFAQKIIFRETEFLHGVKSIMDAEKEFDFIEQNPFKISCNKCIQLVSLMDDNNGVYMHRLYKFITKNFIYNFHQKFDYSDKQLVRKSILFITLILNKPGFSLTQINKLSKKLLPFKNFLEATLRSTSSPILEDLDSRYLSNKNLNETSTVGSKKFQKENDEILAIKQVSVDVFKNNFYFSVEVLTKENKSFISKFYYKSLLKFNEMIKPILEADVIDPLPHLPQTNRQMNDTRHKDATGLASHVSTFLISCIACSKNKAKAKHLLYTFLLNFSKPTPIYSPQIYTVPGSLYSSNNYYGNAKAKSAQQYLPLANILVPLNEFSIESWLKKNQVSHLIKNLIDVKSCNELFNLTESDLISRGLSEKSIKVLLALCKRYKDQVESFNLKSDDTNRIISKDSYNHSSEQKSYLSPPSTASNSNSTQQPVATNHSSFSKNPNVKFNSYKKSNNFNSIGSKVNPFMKGDNLVSKQPHGAKRANSNVPKLQFPLNSHSDTKNISPSKKLVDSFPDTVKELYIQDTERESENKIINEKLLQLQKNIEFISKNDSLPDYIVNNTNNKSNNINQKPSSSSKNLSLYSNIKHVP